VNKLEMIDLCLRVIKAAAEVSLSEEEVARVRGIALAYLDAELGLSAQSDQVGA
jgi:hypothetical protein